MKKLLFFILLLTGAYLSKEYLLSSYAKLFVVDNATKGADMLIILGGNPFTRPHHGAKLYKEGYAPKVYLTTLKEQSVQRYPFLLEQTELYSKILQANNISPIWTIPSRNGGAMSTFDEAVDTAILLQETKIKKIILVTDLFHTARALRTFQKVFDANNLSHITIEVSVATNNHFNQNNWWHYEAGIISIFLETLKSCVYFFIDDSSKYIIAS
jgi:uncharacterized SAM-binding protein YcdF (DUF218 family)